jgi:ectoine hydroxylase-related dioxygenase (phytanoyl-CoA dioxygenase family)
VAAVLTQDQRAEFDRTGLLRLRAAVPVADAHAMADHLWSLLARRSGVDRQDPATWTTARPTAFQAVSRAGRLDGMWSAPVCAAVDDLLGPTGTHRERPRVLMTFPEAARPWTVPSAGWHFDYVPTQVEPGLRALQVFVVLADVLPHGGATVVLTGSHRLVAGYLADMGVEPRPRAVRSHLSAKDPWLRELWGDPGSPADRGDGRDQRLIAGAVIDDVPLRVVEASGSAGDVYLMHSDCFHAVAANARSAPRIMATSVVSRVSRS